MASEPPDFQSLSGQKIIRRMSVEEISFAAHVDYTHNSQFIEMVDAKYIVLFISRLDLMVLDSSTWRATSNGTIEKRFKK